MADEVFTKEACERIKQAIVEAEKLTSGELHVHLSKHSKDPYKDAIKAFNVLGMQNTKLRNSVLFFFATKDHRFAVIGDKGINDIVHQDFWNDVVDKIAKGFAAGTPIDALCDAITLCGSKLQHYFPIQADDQNELSDDVTTD